MNEFKDNQIEENLELITKDLEEKYQVIIEGKDRQIELYKKEAEHLRQLVLNLGKEPIIINLEGEKIMKDHNDMWSELIENRINSLRNRDYYPMNNPPSTPVVDTIKRNNFVIDFFINENAVEIHTKFILSPKILSGTDVKYPSEGEINSELLNFLREIEEIPGIEEIQTVEKYSILLMKGKAFDWNDILPHIEQKLIDYQE